MGDVSERGQTLEADYVDVDKWEIALSPHYYGKQFRSGLATVQLASHQPLKPRLRAGEPEPYFYKWLLLGDAGHQLYMEQRFKGPFITALKDWRTIQPAEADFQASYGAAHIPVRVFVDSLQRAGCTTLRLKAYGQKLPLIPRFRIPEPAEATHPLAQLNEWDIGVTYRSKYIWLFLPKQGKREGLDVYPMLIPSSNDYGSILVRTQLNGRSYKVKIYPRLVHVIKSYHSRLQGGKPRSVFTVKAKGKVSGELIHKLASLPSTDLGGFRIEVTVMAQTLEAARAEVLGTHLLRVDTWLEPVEGILGQFTLDARLVTKRGLIQNARWLHQRAIELDIFTGQNVDTPSRLQLTAINDVMAAFGWNAGIQKPTKSNDPLAWWGSAPAQSAAKEQSIWHHLIQSYGGVGNKPELMRDLRKGSTLGYIPCMKHFTNSSHRYWQWSKQPFQIRCSVGACRHTLQEGAAMRYFAKLIEKGTISMEAVGYHRETEGIVQPNTETVRYMSMVIGLG